MPQPLPSTLSAEYVQRVRVRAITPDELHTFAAFSSGPDYTFAPTRPAGPR
jgi:hypothetical protein